MPTWNTTDNSDTGEKIDIRLRLLCGIRNPSILECFAGDGHIFEACYLGLPYLGLDLKPIEDERHVVQCDNRKFLRSADLSEFNFFDLDAYGSPWHQFLIVLNRRRLTSGESIAIAITNGLSLNMRFSGIPSGLRKYLNIPPGLSIPKLHLHQDFIDARIVTESIRSSGLRIRVALRAENARKNMRYYGLLLKKDL